MSFNPDLEQASLNGHGIGEEKTYGWVDPDHPDEFYHLRPLWNKKLVDLRNRYIKYGRNGQPTPASMLVFQRHLHDYMIADWEIYYDYDPTKPVPCTQETKFGLYMNFRVRSDAVYEQCVQLAEDHETRMEAERTTFRHLHPDQSGTTGAELPRVSSEL